jgi:IS1 family transposase
VAREGITTVAAPADDVIEMDELCIRPSPSLWLWIAISRQVGQILGFVFGDRTDAMLALVWSDVPPDYRDKPVCTDYWEAYARFFPEHQHFPCEKGSGQTSQVEGFNTKWRQRQSGLVRRSCGVHPGIEDDLYERYVLLMGSHNQECARRWRRQQLLTASTLLNP